MITIAGQSYQLRCVLLIDLPIHTLKRELVTNYVFEFVVCFQRSVNRNLNTREKDDLADLPVSSSLYGFSLPYYHWSVPCWQPMNQFSSFDWTPDPETRIIHLLARTNIDVRLVLSLGSNVNNNKSIQWVGITDRQIDLAYF